MVWLGACSKGMMPLVILNEGTVDHAAYIEKVLSVGLKYWNQVLGSEWIFQQHGTNPDQSHPIRSDRKSSEVVGCRKMPESQDFDRIPDHSDTFRNPTSSDRNLIPRIPTSSGRNLIARIPTTSDELLSDFIKSDNFSDRIRQSDYLSWKLHSLYLTQQWCRDNFPTFINSENWSPNSSDLSPLGYSIWDELANSINWDKVKSKTGLIQQIKLAHKKVRESVVFGSCVSCTNRSYGMYQNDGKCLC